MEPYFRKAVRKIGWVEVLQGEGMGKRGSLGGHLQTNHGQ
jgi:hypothetical protein